MFKKKSKKNLVKIKIEIRKYKDDALLGEWNWLVEPEFSIKSICQQLDDTLSNVTFDRVSDVFDQSICYYKITTPDNHTENSNWRIPKKLLQTLSLVNDENSIEILKHLNHRNLNKIILHDNKTYVDAKALNFLIDLKVPHTAKVIKGMKKPFYFVIGDMVFESDTSNYYEFLKDSIPVQSWMLEDIPEEKSKNAESRKSK